MDFTRREWGAGIAAVAIGCTSEQGSPPGSADAPSGGSIQSPHVIDLHCDTPMLFRDGTYDIGARNSRGDVDIPRMREGGVTAVFFSVYSSASRYTELESVQEALDIIDSIRTTVARFPDELTLAASTADIEAAKTAGKIAVVLGVEGGHMINSSLAVLRSLYELGGRYLTLTHSRDTPWCGSSGEEGNAGLSDFGREVVTTMNGLGMMVDISHVSDQSFWDVIETSKAPVIASHSSARALATHKRNMTDEMIRATAERGGVVHVNYYNVFLDDAYAERSRQWNEANPEGAGNLSGDSRTEAKLAAIGRTSLDTLLDHFEHVAQVGGIEAVGLGSDFDGVDGELPEGVEDISKIPNISAGLEGRGFSGADVEKILGGNSLRVFRDIESAADRQA